MPQRNSRVAVLAVRIRYLEERCYSSDVIAEQLDSNPTHLLPMVCSIRRIQPEAKPARLLAALSVAIGLLVQAPALADPLQQTLSVKDRCNADNASPDDRIKSCTDAIEAAGDRDQALALLYLNRGNGWYLKGNGDKARADYEAAGKISPGWSRPHVGLGNLLRDKKEFANALLEYEQALQFDPENVRAYVNRAQLFAAARENQKAVADYDAAIRIAPSDPNNYFQRSLLWINLQQPARAVSDLDKSIELSPGNAFYFQTRGWARFIAHDADGAQADLTQAIKLKPDFALAYFQRANVRTSQSRLDPAIDDYTEAIGLLPNRELEPLYRYHRALAFNRKGRYDAAIQDFDAAIALDAAEKVRDPAHQNCCFDRRNLLFVVRGEAREAKGDHDGAIADYSEANRLDPKDITALIDRGNAHHAQQRYDLAIEDYGLAIAVDASSFLAFTNRGNSWRAKHENKKAAEDYLAALRINPDYAYAHTRLGQLYQADENYIEAAKQYEHAVRLLEKSSPDTIVLADAFSDLAFAKSNLGNLPAAAKSWEKSLALHEKIEGKDHINVARALAIVASAYSFAGRYQEAEAALKRALSIAEGTQDPWTLGTINFSLGILYAQTRSYEKEEDALMRALAAYERLSPVDDVAIGKTLTGLANAYWQAGKFLEAAQSAERALVPLERSAPQSSALARALEALAVAYRSLDRDLEAEGLLRRVLEIDQVNVGPDSLVAVAPLAILADIYLGRGKYPDALEMYTRVREIRERELGLENADTAQTIYDIASLYRAQGKLKEAEDFYQQSLAIRERTLPNSTTVAWSLIGLASVYKRQQRFAEAEKTYERALALDEKVLGPNHPDLAYLLDDLAILNRSAGNFSKALDYSRRATSSLIAHAAAQSSSFKESAGYGGLISGRLSYFYRHLLNLSSVRDSNPGTADSLGREAFEIAQWANFSTTAAAVQQMSARFAAGDGSLAGLVRQRQDYEGVWRDREKAFSEALANSKSGDEGAKTLQTEISELESKISEITGEIERKFPEYAALSRPKPIPVGDIQKLLSKDEVLAFFATGSGSSFIFGMTRERYEWKELETGTGGLIDEVAAFRQGLEVDAIGKLYDVVQDRQAAKLFDLGRAHRLYDKLFSPIAQLLKDKRHLIIVPSGPLTALPFHLLVTDKPSADVPDRLSGYRNVAWLLKRLAISILPSVNSLRSLSQRQQENVDRKPLVAFGDPVFDRNELKVAANQAANGGLTRGYATFWQGTSIDRAQLARLPRLQDTADEIRAVAQQLGSSPADIHLREDATEHNVKTLPLSSFRVVYFATHGLVAGEVEGLGEPALALTLPDRPSTEDDGLLTASEAAQLRLNADWVVLSACNTFAGEKPGAEALSGLARAFFYAGARALMVSHWRLDSSAATMLTTATFRFLESGLSHSEAMRKAMLKFMNDPRDPRRAYPAFWAPFVVIGRG